MVLPVRKKNIKFNKCWIGNEEVRAAVRSLRSGDICGDGPFGKKLETEISRKLNIKFSFLTTSCTSALEMAIIALRIKEGDEVILPSFSFVSAANVVALRGARPVFCEIDEKHYNIDPLSLKEKITKRTKAIIVVHYGGFSCDMDAVSKIARDSKLYLIEDAAQALGSKYKDKYLGTIGDIGCFSFHGTKNVTCGEGGCFVTNSEEIAKKAEIIREKGTDRSSFLRGQIEKYSWVGLGSSYVLSDVLAAIAYEQFRKIDRIIEARTKIASYYLNHAQDMNQKIILPVVPEHCKPNWHIFAVRVRPDKRNWLLKALRAKGIEAAFHFVPLHSSSFGRLELGYKEDDFPVTELVANSIIRLPIYPGLLQKDLDYVLNALRKTVSSI
jgi:dTDP-4-amino-4,6-dideoxygalactose transaminase